MQTPRNRLLYPSCLIWSGFTTPSNQPHLLFETMPNLYPCSPFILCHMMCPPSSCLNSSLPYHVTAPFSCSDHSLPCVQTPPFLTSLPSSCPGPWLLNSSSLLSSWFHSLCPGSSFSFFTCPVKGGGGRGGRGAFFPLLHISCSSPFSPLSTCAEAIICIHCVAELPGCDVT